jgi:hypothetical protein
MEPQHWATNAGGCDAKCGAVLQCGHACPYDCHSFSESEVPCREACPLQLPCGHGCSRFCNEACTCDQCTPVITTELEAWNLGKDSTGALYTISDVHSDPEYALHRSSANIDTYQDPSLLTGLGSSPERSRGGRGNRGDNRGSRGNRGSERGGAFSRNNRGSRGNRDGRGWQTPVSGLDLVQISSASQPPIPRTKSYISTASDPGQRPNLSRFSSESTVPEHQDVIPGRILTTPQHHPGVIAWNTWNAEKADREANEQHRLLRDSNPVVNASAVTYWETYIP